MTTSTPVTQSTVPNLHIKTKQALLALPQFNSKPSWRMPEWVKISKNVLVSLPEPQLREALSLLFCNSLAGFTCSNVFKDEQNPKALYTIREFWELVSSLGFVDHVNDYMNTWHKPYACLNKSIYNGANHRGKPVDYAYSKGKHPSEWNTNLVYSHVLGSAPDFFRTAVYDKSWFAANQINHIIEPMAASGELCYFGHFSHPGLTYSMIDLDASAVDRTRNLPWAEDAQYEYVLGDVLDKKVWNKMKLPEREHSLCFIGKQSHNIFSPEQVVQMMKCAFSKAKFVMLETMEYPVSYFIGTPGVHDFTPAHLKNSKVSIGIHVNQNKMHNRLSGESNLEVSLTWKEKGTTIVRPFITYEPWHCYTPQMLIAMLRAAGLQFNVWFQDDYTNDYHALTDLTWWSGEYLKDHNSDTAGSVIRLVFEAKG